MEEPTTPGLLYLFTTEELIGLAEEDRNKRREILFCEYEDNSGSSTAIGSWGKNLNKKQIYAIAFKAGEEKCKPKHAKKPRKKQHTAPKQTKLPYHPAADWIKGKDDVWRPPKRKRNNNKRGNSY